MKALVETRQVAMVLGYTQGKEDRYTPFLRIGKVVILSRQGFFVVFADEGARLRPFDLHCFGEEDGHS
jgi:hypothetical protein